MTEVMEKRRKPWLSWVPAVVLSVAIIAAIGFAVIATATGLGKPAPAPTDGQVTDKNWSIFTKEGLAYIDRSREVRIDLTDAPVEAEPLGLPENGSLTIGPHATVSDYYFIFYGGGDGPGGDEITVTELTIETENGAISHIRAPLRDAFSFRNTLNSLLAEVGHFGWESPNVDDLYDMVAEASATGEEYEFTLGPGTRLGVEVTATAHCGHDGFCLTEYVVSPAVR